MSIFFFKYYVGMRLKISLAILFFSVTFVNLHYSWTCRHCYLANSCFHAVLLCLFLPSLLDSLPFLSLGLPAHPILLTTTMCKAWKAHQLNFSFLLSTQVFSVACFKGFEEWFRISGGLLPWLYKYLTSKGKNKWGPMCYFENRKCVSFSTDLTLPMYVCRKRVQKTEFSLTDCFFIIDT